MDLPIGNGVQTGGGPILAARRTVTLTDSERRQWESIVRRDPRPYLREKAAAVLKVADGASAHAVARHGLLRPRDPDTGYAWLDEFAGPRTVLRQPARRRPPTDQEKAAVVETVHQPPALFGLEGTRWRLCDLPQVSASLGQLGTLSGVWRRLKRCGVRSKQSRDYLHSPDLAYREKVAARDEALAQALMDALTLRFVDEVTCYQQPEGGWAYYQVGAGRQPLALRSCQPNRQHRVVGALDAVTGRVHHRSGLIVGVKELRRFLKGLREAIGAARRLLVVCDNWPIHAQAGVLAAAAEADIELLWLPTYAPWTNPLEKLWRKLKQEVLRLHRYRADWAGLKRRITEFLDQFATGSPELLRYVGLGLPI